MSEHRPDVFAQAREVVAEARLALKPPPRLQLSEWADANYYLSSESAPTPGRWTCLPYQRDIMNALTDPRVERVAFIKSARVGATEIMKAFVGYHVEYDPCTILFIQPDEDGAKGFSKDGIEPLIRDVPSVGERFFKSSNGADSMLHKRFRGGVLQLAGARSPANFRRVSRRIIIGDEVDGYPLSAGKEGDPLALALRRSEYFWNRKIFWASTPTFAGVSNIEREFLKGDQRRRYVPCPHCQEKQVLQFKNLRWPAGQPELAVFVCIFCGCEIEHAQLAWMDEHGEWRPGPHAQFPDMPAPDPLPGYVSFHIWAAYGRAPNGTWGHIAAEWLEATKAGSEKLKTVINTVLGETWQDRGEAPEWRRLYDRREDYTVGTCPAGVMFLTLGVDVQRDRLVYEVVGWGRGKESWSIEADVIMGDTSDLSGKGPWAKVDELLARAFPHASGAELPIRAAAIDSGDQTQTVYNYVRDKEPGRVMAIKGADSGSVLVWPGEKVDITVKGKRVGWLQLWRVAGDIAKTELYGWLKLQLPTDEGRAAGETTPPGYCHFPQYHEHYFKQLTAEQRVPHKTPKGFTVSTWELIPGRENHYLDCRNYARAAAMRAGLDRAGESHWQALERSISADAAPPTGEPPAQPAIAKPQTSWLPSTHSNWLRGRRS